MTQRELSYTIGGMQNGLTILEKCLYVLQPNMLTTETWLYSD